MASAVHSELPKSKETVLKLLNAGILEKDCGTFFRDSLITFEYKRLQRGILGESKQQSSLSKRHLSEFAGDGSSAEQTKHSPAGTLESLFW